MERETKFRAWDKFQNKYVFEGFHICGEVTAFSMMEMIIHETWDDRREKQKYFSALDAWNDFEFEQFLGIKDKSGTDIYEGHRIITRWVDVFSGKIDEKKITIKSIFDYELMAAIIKADECEIIGSIHD